MQTGHRRSVTPSVLLILCLVAGAHTAFAHNAPPLGQPATKYQQIGLFSGTDFVLTTGHCDACRTPTEASWYFRDETIVIPTDPKAQEGVGPDLIPPFLVWLGSPEIIDHAMLTPDYEHVKFTDESIASLRLVPKLSTNQSFYNDASASFFSSHPVRLRGQTLSNFANPTFEARTIWPTDYVLTSDRAVRATAEHRTIAQLIEAGGSFPNDTITTHVLWERGNTSWAGKPVLGAILNGAQGDDDEAHGGHFGIFTGRVGPHGEWADWLMNNFYDLDFVSEKGIIPAMVPMDNYLMDLNSGQSYYRPSALLVLILKRDRIAASYQSAIQTVFRQLYRHELDYDHSRLNCAGLSIDQLRAFGWQIPFQGPSSRIKATAGYFYMAATDQSLASGLKTYRYFSEERTRLLPRVTFEAIGNDALALLQPSDPPRTLTPYEQWLVEDVEAVLYVHIPQLPSSRAMGTFAVASLDDYQHRVPSDRTKWKTIPTAPRPLPSDLQIAPAQTEFLPIPIPILVVVFGVVSVSLFSGRWMYRRRRMR